MTSFCRFRFLLVNYSQLRKQLAVEEQQKLLEVERKRREEEEESARKRAEEERLEQERLQYVTLIARRTFADFRALYVIGWW